MRLGPMELNSIPGLVVSRDNRDTWITMLNDVGLDILRKAAEQVLESGKTAWMSEVAPVAYRMRALKRQESQVMDPAAIAKLEQGIAKVEAERAEAARQKLKELEERAKANAEEGKRVLAEAEAAGLDCIEVELLRDAVAKGKVPGLWITAVKAQLRKTA